MFFHGRILLVAIKRKLYHGLMINFLMIMEKAVCTLGLITLQDQKIKSNNYHFVCVEHLINVFVLFLLQHLNWIKRYSTMKIGRFFFVRVYKHNGPLRDFWFYFQMMMIWIKQKT